MKLKLKYGPNFSKTNEIPVFSITNSLKKVINSEFSKKNSYDAKNIFVSLKTKNPTKNNKTIIKGEPSGLCQYCRYQSRCSNDGNGIEHKPLSAPKKKEDNENGS